jgi:hypothetical protein
MPAKVSAAVNLPGRPGLVIMLRMRTIAYSAASRLRGRSLTAWPAWLAGLLLPLCTGCANWTYERVQIGMGRAECERQFADESYQRTGLGLSHWQADASGARAALVILLSADGRVVGKLQASYRAGVKAGQERYEYRLRGQLDPQRAGLGATGPLDALRAVLIELLDEPGVQTVRSGHAWIAAGLLRLVERWPHVQPQAVSDGLLTEALEHVPDDGEAWLGIDRRGVYLFEYGCGPAR